MTSTKAALVAENERVRCSTLADLKKLHVTSSRLASQAKTWTFLAASGLAVLAGSALVARRLGADKTSRPGAAISSPILSIGLVTGLWIASRLVPRRRNINLI